jgi:hypothetical protein
MMQLRAKAQYPPLNGVIPPFQGIAWDNRNWLIIPLETLIATRHYTANVAKRSTGQAALELV